MTIGEQRAAVVAEAMSWQCTPYHHMGDLKGIGVDCAMFLVRVYAGLGIVPAELDPRPYAAEWHLHHSEELYIDWLEQYGQLIGERDAEGHVTGALPQPGDVSVYRFGRCFSHGVIHVGEDLVVHSYLRQGVVLAQPSQDPLATLGNGSPRPVRHYTLWPEVSPA